MFHCLMALALVYFAYLGLIVLWYLVRTIVNLLMLGIVAVAYLLHRLISPPEPPPQTPARTTAGYAISEPYPSKAAPHSMSTLDMVCIIVGLAIFFAVGKLLVAIGVLLP
jgi:hypothetical protein